MKEYERLTKKDQDWFSFVEVSDSEIYNHLREVENKIENGTLIELPCKVGDMAYYVIKHENDYVIEFGYVKSISIERGGIWLACHYNSGLNYWHKYKENYDKLFFNYAEAKAKLKELKGE